MPVIFFAAPCVAVSRCVFDKPSQSEHRLAARPRAIPRGIRTRRQRVRRSRQSTLSAASHSTSFHPFDHTETRSPSLKIFLSLLSQCLTAHFLPPPLNFPPPPALSCNQERDD